ncbi:LysR family transcriptional regulator [Echinimonas agarilytica]|uniref:LysR family transcriptional regulator n=1 Tax=Echinimonas agarilytica TaxID=1215918 RepID=A0AA42B6M2_9GAMM|nr:LysR family transcriptional regulator [Echinimonas agarilytica]MCM2678864.1 LysR family transcriptional regulator [Echinimonas agarilytica]
MKKTSEQFDLNLLRIFLNVYQYQSMSKAAEHLDLNQSSVSNAMIRLKIELGEVLFLREGRGIKPTAFADEFASQIKDSLATVEAVVANQQHFQPDQTQRTFVVYSNEVMMLMLAPIVAELTQATQCRVEFRETPPIEQRIYDDLSRQKVDAALDLFPRIPSAFQQQAMLRHQGVVIASRHHPRIQGRISQSEYLSEAHVGLRMRRSDLHVVNFLSKQRIPNRKMMCEFSSVMGLMAMCSRSEYLGFVPQEFARQYQDAFELQLLKPPYDFEALESQLIWHRSMSAHSAHQWLREILSTAVKMLN